MNLKKVLILFGLSAVALGSVGRAEALNFTTFSTRASWLASGVTVTGSENFNSIGADTSFTNSTRGLPSLGIASNSGFHTGATIDVSPFLNGATGINGTPILNVRGIDSRGIIRVTFPSAVSAVGFDWENYEDEGDDFRIQVGANIVFDNNSNNGNKGFLGIVSTDGTFNNLEIRRNPTSTGFAVFNAFDNFEFGTATAVPFEFNPAFGLMALGGTFIIKKKLTKRLK